MAMGSGTNGWGGRGNGAGDGTRAGAQAGTLGQDESYLVSVSDLMIGLLFLFIIILMAFALNFRSAEDAAEATLEELVVERDQLARDRAELALDRDRVLAERDRLAAITARLLARDAERAELLMRIKAALSARGLEVEVDLENGILRLPESLLFASNEAELSATGEAAIVILGEVMAELLPCYVGAAARRPCPGGPQDVLEAVLIEGHTDDRPIRGGPFADNWALSAARARNTFLALSAADPALGDLANAAGAALLGLSGYAERRPVIDAPTEAARRVNRRIDLRFLARGPDAQALAELLASLEAALDAP